jgi:hypothetical protein
MKLDEIARKLQFSVRSGVDRLDRDVTGGVAGDLLSDIIANGQAGQVWVTMQTHANIVAVAVLKDFAGIILVQGRQPAEETLQKAGEEKVPILISPLPAFDTVGRIYGMLQPGR